MSAGLVGFTARRSSALWMLLPYIAIEAYVASSRDTWTQSSLAAVNWVSGALLLTTPLIVGATAFDAWRFHHGQWRDDLLQTLRAHRSAGA